jgi:hypothetical protein
MNIMRTDGLYITQNRPTIAQTNDGHYILPALDFLIHSNILILGLSVLVSIGVLNINIGTFNPVHRYTCIYNTVSYEAAVSQFWALEDSYLPRFFDQSMYFFTPTMNELEYAWHYLIIASIKQTVPSNHDIEMYGYSSVINNQHPAPVWNFNYHRDRYWCPVLMHDVDINECIEY